MVKWSMLLSLALVTACVARDTAQVDPTPAAWRSRYPVQVATADSAMVVTAAPLATQVGVDVLRSGGNAIDAAVSVAFALSVVYPTAGNLGGGGFMVSHMGNESAALDFREVAPLAATRDMFLDAKGNVTDRSVVGALAAGVPGSVAGLWEAHRKYGTKPWRELVQPAIALADGGFTTDSAFIEDLASDSTKLARFPASAAQFAPGGRMVPLGGKWRNAALAATLRRIAERGRDEFYAGETAALLVNEMKRSGGIITREDLRRYEAKWREPIEFTLRGHRVISMPPSSSGGLTIALIANILGGLDLGTMGFHSPRAIHTIAEAERMAYERRNRLIADPDFTPVPRESFLSPDTAAALRATIGPAAYKGPVTVPGRDTGRHTTHFSIVDSRGNAVAMTTTLNDGHGSGVTVTGAGFLLNDQMDDFTTKPGVVNAMRLRQWEANAIQPGKRMLSSMTPTIVLDSAGAPMLVTGASGGTHIITGVTQVILNVIEYGMSLGEAMGAPRFHAQDYPDSLYLEPGGYGDGLVRALSESGHHPTLTRTDRYDFSVVQSILRANGRWQGVSEPRLHGLARGY
jgi:gamma-glutamyltranspeptidase/glutathione hydrolase